MKLSRPQRTKRLAHACARRVLPFAALAVLCACGPPAGTRSEQAARQSLVQQPSPSPQPSGGQSLCRGRQSPLPRPDGFVNDFAKVIDDETQARLESKLTQLKDSSGVEFAVVTVETTGGRDIFDYSLDVACGWGVGPPAGGRGGGLLLLAAVKDRKWRVQVGRSLEADLPDDVVKGFGDRMAESFRRGEYGPGIEGCVEDHINRLAGK